LTSLTALLARLIRYWSPAVTVGPAPSTARIRRTSSAWPTPGAALTTTCPYPVVPVNVPSSSRVSTTTDWSAYALVVPKLTIPTRVSPCRAWWVSSTVMVSPMA
jgi:hypothetical protein